MTLRFLIPVVLGYILSGCAAMEPVSDALGGILDPLLEQDNAEPPHELTEYTAEIKPEIVWQETIGVGSDGLYLKLGPAIVNDKLFIADHDGLVQARNRSNGDLLWETDTNKRISAGPGIGSHAVLVGTSDAELLALNPDDGSILWTQQISSEVLATPQTSGNVVVARGVDGKLVGLEESTGANLWIYERSVPPLSLRGIANPVIEGNNVIEGHASGKLVALRLSDGKVEWETSVVMPEGRSELERLVDLDADPLIVEDVIFLGSFQGGAFAISTHDGRTIWWRRELSVYNSLAGDWNYLYLSDERGDVWALEQRNGASLWKQTDLHERHLSAPAIYKNSIVVGDFEGYLHWLSQLDGRLLGRLKISDSPIDSKPLVVDDVLYVYAKDGTLTALISD